MGLANCKECGKLYMQTAAGLCPDCFRVEELNELRVVHYLQDHCQASVREVHEATGVSESTILKMIRKGRITSNVELSYPCSSCGKLILEGRVCEECGRKVRNQIKPGTNPAQKSPLRPQSSRLRGEGLHTTFSKK